MTQQYAIIITSLVSFFSITHVSNSASLFNTKIKFARVSLVVLFMLMGGMAKGQQAIAPTFSNQIFKTQVAYYNHYLAYASSHGIGGGGGGGHGGSYYGNIRGHDTFQVFSFPIKLKFYNSI
jgi:hypothetical protein